MQRCASHPQALAGAQDGGASLLPPSLSAAVLGCLRQRAGNSGNMVCHTLSDICYPSSRDDALLEIDTLKMVLVDENVVHRQREEGGA